MQFHISRTSSWGDAQPCEEAYPAPCTHIDVRTWKTPEQYRPGGAEAWYAEGANHRIENDMIMRDSPTERWFVDIESLEALWAFQEKYGELVIRTAYFNHTLPAIEIYDDYRE